MNITNTEITLLGCILQKNEIMTDCIGVLNPNDFSTTNGILYEKMAQMFKRGSGIDLVTLSTALGNQLQDVGGMTYLAKVTASVESTLNYKEYIKIIAKDSLRRRAVKACSEAIESLGRGEDVIDTISNLQSDLIKAPTSQDKIISPSELMEMCVNYVVNNAGKQGIPGISTGYNKIDKMMGGLRKGDLVILSARPSMGKTALALNIASNIDSREKVLFFELEMSPEKLGTRLVSSDSGVSSWGLSFGRVSDTELTSVEESARFIESKDNLYVFTKPAISLSEIFVQSKKMQLQKGLSVIFVDHIGLMTPANPNSSKNDQIGAITAGLKRLAKELNVCVVALSQLNRCVEVREDKRPMLSDLRDSGNIEQDADVVMMLYRDDYYKSTERPEVSELEVNLTKNRDGETGMLAFKYELKNQRIKE